MTWLQYFFPGNVLLHIIFVVLFWMALIPIYFMIAKRFALEKRGVLANGIIQSLTKTTFPVCNDRLGELAAFSVCYQFSHAEDQHIEHKAKLLVFGYIKNIYNDTPQVIKNAILSFYDKKIKFKAVLTNKHLITRKLFATLTEGDTIKIMYDPKHPKKFNMPQNEYVTRGNSCFCKNRLLIAIFIVLIIIGLFSISVSLALLLFLVFFVLCSVGVWILFGLLFIFYLCCKSNCKCTLCRNMDNTHYRMMVNNNLYNDV